MLMPSLSLLLILLLSPPFRLFYAIVSLMMLALHVLAPPHFRHATLYFADAAASRFFAAAAAFSRHAFSPPRFSPIFSCCCCRHAISIDAAYADAAD